MLGQPSSMLIPEVVGFRLHGRLPEGATATDLVLTVTEMLRKKGVVGKFVEFYGSGLSSLSVPDRATIANMAPEYGATMGFFPVDRETLAYLQFTARSFEQIALTEAYCKEQMLFRTDSTPEPLFNDTLELDLGTVEATVAGPKRPQDRVLLRNAKSSFTKVLEGSHSKNVAVQNNGDSFDLSSGAVVIAAITSCTNTSNPSLMLGAGLLAKKAVERGLSVKPWVKTSLAPGSKSLPTTSPSRALTNISTSSISIWWATAAQLALATAALFPMRSARPSRTTIFLPLPCSAAIAISKAAFTRWSAQTISRLHRW